GGGESLALTLTVGSAEGTDATSATALLSVTATAVAEAPKIGSAASRAGSEDPGSTITLERITVSKDDTDDTLSATISGIAAGWTVYDNGVSISDGATVAVADVTGGKLSVVAPDGGGESLALTLTVGSAEGTDATSATALLSVTATAVAEVP